MTSPDALPAFIDKSIKPWTAHNSADWPTFIIDGDDFRDNVRLAMATANTDDKAVIKSYALGLLGGAAYTHLLKEAGVTGATMGRWNMLVRSTEDPNGTIVWTPSDLIENIYVVASAVVTVDNRAACVRLPGWMHVGELLGLSNDGVCKAPFRPAQMLPDLARHLVQLENSSTTDVRE